MAQIAPAHVYGIMYGMHRTTIYLPEDMKARVAQMAQIQRITEAEFIRSAIEKALERPRPRGGLFHSGDPTWASRDEELLAEGFGEWES
ncbi:MAG: CopG family transcriptional regulator [Thermoleophilia bacterium]